MINKHHIYTFGITIPHFQSGKGDIVGKCRFHFLFMLICFFREFRFWFKEVGSVFLVFQEVTRDLLGKDFFSYCMCKCLLFNLPYLGVVKWCMCMRTDRKYTETQSCRLNTRVFFFLLFFVFSLLLSDPFRNFWIPDMGNPDLSASDRLGRLWEGWFVSKAPPACRYWDLFNWSLVQTGDGQIRPSSSVFQAVVLQASRRFDLDYSR